MILSTCQHEKRHKHGTRNGRMRYKCTLCGKVFYEETARPLGDMRITMRQATTALSMMLEGCSVRSVQRMTGLCRQTLADLILMVGANCQRLLDAKVQGVKADEVQADELWSFVGLKEKNRIARGYSAEYGDSWTFYAIDRNTKLILAHEVGQRDTATCWAFLGKLSKAINGKFQLTTDALPAYKLNVPYMFGSRVHFAQLIKTYAAQQEVTRYSPARIISAHKRPLFGEPEWDRISTSHIERFNLTVRMTMRRFTRLTNAHSKSRKHHVAMQAIFVAWYNFCRRHEAIGGRTPGMASGLTEKPWATNELIDRAAKF